MERSSATTTISRAGDTRSNGGFPSPCASDPVRVYKATHSECGATTRIRVPRVLGAAAVRHVVCDTCKTAFSCGEVTEAKRPFSAITDAVPILRAPEWLERQPGPMWAIASIPLATVLVAGGLVLSGGSDVPAAIDSPSFREASRTEAKAIVKPDFTLALPPGWSRTNPPEGAAFAARTADGDADAVLWIERNPGLGFAEFEERSLRRLRELAGSAKVLERVRGFDRSGDIVRLRGASDDGITYDVTLRAVGELRYYLATSSRVDASILASEGAALIHEVFVPKGSDS